MRCKGGNCPYKHKRFTSKGKRVILRKLARTYREGTIIEVRITKSETIGKLTRLRIRAGDNPARLDRCLRPGKPNKPFTLRVRAAAPSLARARPAGSQR